MPEIDPTQRLMEGFTPSPVPPRAPDGGPQLTPATTEPIPIAPISQCQLGPCIRYHELATKLDAQDPQDGSKGRAYLQIVRTCYPSPGIEVDIGSNPVRKCNLWEPRLDVADVRERYREAYSRTANARLDLKLFHESWPDHADDRKDDPDGPR